MPPPRHSEPFCQSVAALLRNQADLPPRGEWRTLHIDEANPVIGRHLSQIDVYDVKFYSEWQWPSLMNGGIGTTDEEMVAAVEKKLRDYRQPDHISETHLVVYGRGPQRTRIASPFSAEQLNHFSDLSAALRAGPFAAMAILCLRDFYWTPADGWLLLSKVL